jgi:hypothetical protein
MSTKKRYFIKYVKKGKTYFKDQDGKRASRAKAEKSKKAIYLLNQRTGELVKRERQAVKRVAAGKSKKASVLRPYNSELGGEIKRSLEKGQRIFIQKDGKVFEVVSKEAKSNLTLFNFELNTIFYSTLKRKIDSPFFDLRIIEDKKANTILFDLDSINLDEASIKERPEIKELFEQFIEESKKAFSKYFKPYGKKGKKKK